MKRILTLTLAALLAFSLLAACGGQDTSGDASGNQTGSPPPEQNTPDQNNQGGTGTDTPVPPEPGHVRVGGLRGPGGMGIVKLLEDAENGQTLNTYESFYGNSADELTPKFLQRELDIIAVPANLASILYHNTNGAAKVFAITTRGVLYIVEKGGQRINSISDLRGQEMFSVGKGSSHEFTQRYIFERNGLNPDTDVTVDWIVEPPAVVAAMAAQDHAIAMLPQPFVTVAQTQIQDFRIALDLTQEWEKLGTGTQFLGTVWIVHSDFAENNPGALEIFMEEFAASTDFVNNNHAEGAALVEKFVGVGTPIAQRAIPHCNLVAISGAEMKPIMHGFLEVLLGLAPQSIGGSLPGDDFYYGA